MMLMIGLNKKISLFIFMLLVSAVVQASSICGNDGVWLQVLGSSSYLIWHNGKARILVDMGAGSALRFKQSSYDAL